MDAAPDRQQVQAEWSMSDTYSRRLVGIVLPDANERPVQLDMLWADRPAVIAFLRHYG